MRRIIVVGFLVSSALLAKPRPRTQASVDYGLGSNLGACVAARCGVFRGVIATESAKSGEPIVVQVQEALFGLPNPPATIAVPYEDENGDRRDGIGSPAATWAGVPIAKNTPVVIILGLGRGFGVYPGEAVTVTADQRHIEVIRALCEEAKRLESSPDLIAASAASLSGTVNPGLAGFLFAYLQLAQARNLPSADGVCAILSQMLGNPSFPPGQARQITAFISFRYASQTTAGRAAVLRRLAELGQQKDDPELADAAYEGLARLSTGPRYDGGILTLIPPDQLAGLKRAYLASAAARGNVKRSQNFDPAFRKALGIQMN
jgi:hypothetical protein